MTSSSSGVSGFSDPKFWAALLCHCLSLPLFFETGVSWGSFQILMPFLIAFIIVTTLAWDYRVIGDPNELHNLILHAFSLVACVFLLNRLMTAENFLPFLGAVPALQSAGEGILGAVPYLEDFLAVVSFALKWLGYAVILFFVSGAILFPARIATALLFVFSLIFIAVSVGRNVNPSLWTFGAGLLLQAVAFVLERADGRGRRFWSRVADALRKGGDAPATEVKIKIDLLRTLYEEGALGENRFRAIVASRLGVHADDPRLTPVCVRVAEQLSRRDCLAESREGKGGWRFVLSVPAEPSDFFAFTARTVRFALTLGFTVAYILSPIDFIPDATPVFGVADDMLLGTVGLLSSLRTVLGERR